jgi:transketolase
MESSEERCRRYRRRILDLSQKVTAMHVAPAFSCMEIVDLIYNELMRPQDIFIMSKGHGCMAQYVVLEDKGILSHEDLENYCKPQGRLGAHPDYGVPGIAASTGSLGHGLSIAVGQAYAEKLKGGDTIVYCLLSDGEMQEGSTWEAMMMAVNLQVGNLIAFVDHNDFGGLERISEGQPATLGLATKAQAFGWVAMERNGHNLWVIVAPLGAPTMFVCHTIKGKGVSFMENNPIFHYRSPSPDEYQQALRELAVSSTQRDEVP